MDKEALVKILVLEHIQRNRILVRLGSEEEVAEYQAMLEKLKEHYMKRPLNQLEAMARGCQAEVA